MISVRATPSHVSYTKFLNPLYNIFSPHQPAHRIARTLAHTHVCFERVTSTVENDLIPPYSQTQQAAGAKTLSIYYKAF